MDNFVEVVGLEPVLKKHGIANHNQTFETLYSNLIGDPSHAKAVVEIEKYVWDYFWSLELPDHLTFYDLLVLSQREKDLIATFNWDPFLFQACVLNCRTAKPPRTAFLHGCVALGAPGQAGGFAYLGETECGAGTGVGASAGFYASTVESLMRANSLDINTPVGGLSFYINEDGSFEGIAIGGPSAGLSISFTPGTNSSSIKADTNLLSNGNKKCSCPKK